MTLDPTDRAHDDAKIRHIDDSIAHMDHDALIEMRFGFHTIEERLDAMEKRHDELFHRVFVGNGDPPLSRRITKLEEGYGNFVILKGKVAYLAIGLLVVLVLLHSKEVLTLFKP